MTSRGQRTGCASSCTETLHLIAPVATLQGFPATGSCSGTSRPRRGGPRWTPPWRRPGSAVRGSWCSTPPAPTGSSTSCYAHDTELAELEQALAAGWVEYELRHHTFEALAGDELVALAGELDATLLVIGLRHRSPVGKFLLGSVAQTVLLDAPCPGSRGQGLTIVC